jgi:hypothetical protein
VVEVAQTIVDRSSYRYEEMGENYKPVITVVGEKGDGKTSLIYGLSGTKFFLSYDKKSKRPLENFPEYQKPENIKNFRFFDASKYYSQVPSSGLVKEMSPEVRDQILKAWQDSCVTTYDYTNFLLDNIEKENPGPDWLIFDASEVLSKVCEQVMRRMNDLKPVQGVQNRNLWKERNIWWDSVYQRAVRIVRRGVIYTTYYKQVDKEIQDGNVVESSTQPAWYGSMMLETDVVLYVFTRVDPKTGEERFFVRTKSKLRDMPNGVVFDVTYPRTLPMAVEEYLGGK